MLLFLADEDLHNGIVRGLSRRQPRVDVVRVQDVGLSGRDDATVLEWAAQHERIIITHDASTMVRHAYQRIMEGKRMPGLIVAVQALPLSLVIIDVHLVAEIATINELEQQVIYLPLK